MPASQLPKLQVALRDAKLSAVLLTNFADGTCNPNFLYCTGYDGYGCLFISTNGTPTLFAPQMEAARAKHSGIRVQLFRKDTLSKLRRKAGKTLGIDYTHTDLELGKKLRKHFPGKRQVNISPLLERLRLVKTSWELRSLAMACVISDTIYANALRNFHRFKTERDVAAFMNAESARMGVSLSFDTIVASGPNAAIPHHKPTAQKLRKGFCVIDFGVKVNGYCSDTTRTFYIGNPTARHRKLYDLVLHAQQEAIAKSGQDRRCSAIHHAAAATLGAYRKQFIHSVGHGVGVQIHEAPSLSQYSKHLLQDNVPFTIEPGIYFPNKLGIRIEDTLVLRKGTPRALTKFSKELIRVK